MYVYICIGTSIRMDRGYVGLLENPHLKEGLGLGGSLPAAGGGLPNLKQRSVTSCLRNRKESEYNFVCT